MKYSDFNLIKLSTGEMVVTKINPSEESTFQLEKPMQVIFTQGQNGLQFTLLPWMNDPTEIREEHIIARSDPHDIILNEYIRATTGIITNSTVN
jgi:hypothetical protein